jgi:hypothetical protein
MGLVVPSIYRHVQTTAATTWTIVHNLSGGEGRVPLVDCAVDVDGEIVKMIPSTVEKVDNNTVSVTWSTARSGSATVIV